MRNIFSSLLEISATMTIDAFGRVYALVTNKADNTATQLARKPQKEDDQNCQARNIQESNTLIIPSFLLFGFNLVLW